MIIVVVFSVAKSRACLVEYNDHDSLQARLTEVNGHYGFVRNLREYTGPKLLSVGF